MQRGKSVKIKEVIESLCKLLSELGVDSVPSTDTFRRAKFNKGDAVGDLWRLLYSLLSKLVWWECTCTHEHDMDARARLVCGLLWQFGYCAPWLAWGEGAWEHVRSRDLLLALGWAISSGDLLESLLRERASGTLTTLLPRSVPDSAAVLLVTFDPEVPDTRPRVEPPAGMGQGAGQQGRGLMGQGAGPAEWERGLRRLQWEQGKLRLLWRGLHAAQSERARLLHHILSSTHGPLDTCPPTGCTGLSKELERLQADIRVLEIYLDWKQMEPLFWCWMDSVIDTELAEPSSPSHRGAVAMVLKSVVVKGACCQGDSRRRGMDELSEALLMLQVQLKAWQVELIDHTSPSESVKARSEKAKIEEMVKLRLHGLTKAYAASRPTCKRYRLRPLEHPTHRPPRPTKHCPLQAGQPIEAQASHLIEILREEEAGLQQEVERLRRGQREELQELASRLEGVVLIPPLKR